MDNERTDADIIREALTDRSAFAEIFDRHYDAISSYLARRLPRHLADELAATTFLIAFERRASYDHAYPSARPWLFGIATNLLKRHRRDEHRRVRAYAEIASEVSIDSATDLDARSDASMKRAAIASALAALSAEDRDVLLLQALGELSYSEIATALDVPIGTVRSRLHRVRRRLGEVLMPEGVSARD